MKLKLNVVFLLMLALTISFILGGCSQEETSIPTGGTDSPRTTGKNQNAPSSQAPPENSVPVHSSDSSADTAGTFSMFCSGGNDLIFSINFPYLFHSDGAIYDSTFPRAMNEQKPLLLAVVDGWVYFWRKNDRCLGRMRLDGTDVTIFNNITFGSPDAYLNPEQAVITENWFYYNENGSGMIYRIPLVENTGFDSKELVKVAMVQWFYIENNWLYYKCFFDGVSQIHKMKIDGSEDTLLCNGNEHGMDMYMSDGWIYFMYNINNDINNRANDNITLFKMRNDGTDVTQILTDLGNGTQIGGIDGGWIYYYKHFPDNHLYFELRRTRTDGSETETLLLSDRLFSLGGAQPFNVIGSYIFFTPDGGEIPRICVDGTELGIMRWLPNGGFQFSSME